MNSTGPRRATVPAAPVHRPHPGRRRVGGRLAAVLAAAAVLGGWVAGVRAQSIIANLMLESLTFELHSVRDDVVLYRGDPQELLRLQARPVGLLPRVDLGPGVNPTLRIRDLSLFETLPPPETVYVEGEETVQEAKEPVPQAQTWDVRVAPSAPTEFILQCEGGRGTFDLTDLPVKQLHVHGDSTNLRVQFSRPNRVELERCQLTAKGGKLELNGALNAHAKSVTLQCRDAECNIEVTGKPFAGETEIYFEGIPRQLRVAVSRQIGVRLEGPAATIAPFDTKNIERRGLALYTRGYDEQRCKVLLHFAEPIPRVEAVWE